MDANPTDADPAARKSDERKAFFFLTILTWPVLAFLVVTGYGFLVWIYQMFAGPPGPMH